MSGGNVDLKNYSKELGRQFSGLLYNVLRNLVVYFVTENKIIRISSRQDETFPVSEAIVGS